MADKKYKKMILERPKILGDDGISELGDSVGIEIPYPCTNIYMRNNK